MLSLDWDFTSDEAEAWLSGLILEIIHPDHALEQKFEGTILHNESWTN